MKQKIIKTRPLPAAKLCWKCDPATLSFKTTDQLEELDYIPGQDRAVEAIRFGTGMAHKGYNIFALGPDHLDKHDIVRRFLEEKATSGSAPSDWCYVYNFAEPRKPRALELPAGKGIEFKRDMDRLAEDIPLALKSAFESEEYQTRTNMIQQEVKASQDKALAAVEEEAKRQSMALRLTPLGFTFLPLRDGKVIPPAEFQKLSEQEQENIRKKIEGLQQKLEEVLEQTPELVSGSRAKMRKLNEETASYAVGHPVDELKTRYKQFPHIITYLDAVQTDVVENVQLIVRTIEEENFRQGPTPRERRQFSLDPQRYMANLLVDNSKLQHAPVIQEDEPSYDRLRGRIEYRAEMGALVTDFHLITAGALHKANGGYLVLDALKLLMRPYAWEALKQSLKAGEIRMEPLGHALGILSTESLEPEPIRLNTKVVIVGERLLYYLLNAYDPEFSDLFKVAADFEDELDRSEKNLALYARMIASLARREKLLPFTREAVAKILERAARFSGDSEKLSTRLKQITDLLCEAHFYAIQNETKSVETGDVEHAIEAQERRQSRVRERILEETTRGVILIDTKGKRAGQVNGLSVIDLGSFAFGRPSRITARVRLGKGEVIDIEREVKLGGPIHSKGVLILGGFLGAHYHQDRPLSLSASLVFEQSYGGVEGDSASLAELCALLSAIADAPMAQNLAVTGSVNQWGEVQAIGGVNEKIEGFFDLCAARGLDGSQGVIIPEANVKHLMLDERVLKAARDNKFHIYPANHVDQALEKLSGMAAGIRDKNGRFSESSFNSLVQKRLTEFAEQWRKFGTQAQGQKIA